jgi:hypothetical protein
MEIQARGERHRDHDRDQWAPYFEAINRRVAQGEDLEASVELLSDDVGGPQAERLPLESITHEDEDDQVAIGLGGRGARFPSVLYHFVDKPRLLHVHETDDGRPISLEIVSVDGTHTVVWIFWPRAAGQGE